MFTIVLWWGVIGWCIAMVAIGYVVDCRRNFRIAQHRQPKKRERCERFG